MWQLFARHTTMTLIILYLVYSQVSTVVSWWVSCAVGGVVDIDMYTYAFVSAIPPGRLVYDGC